MLSCLQLMHMLNFYAQQLVRSSWADDELMKLFNVYEISDVMKQFSRELNSMKCIGSPVTL